MKKLFTTLLVILFAVTGVFAQQQKYYRVQIFTNEKGLQRLSSLGVTIDHGESKKGSWFTSDFSENELGIIKRNGFQYKVLISDVAAYYVARNSEADAVEETPAAPAACATYTRPPWIIYRFKPRPC